MFILPNDAGLKSRIIVLTICFATVVCDKVALLIGNRDYDHGDKLGMLYHPTNDVRDLAGVLQSIGFKVRTFRMLELK